MYKHQWYKSPISLPEATAGKISVRHVVVTESIPVVSARQALLRGIRGLDAKLKKPLTIHELHEDGVGKWMSDSPEELNQIEEALFNNPPFGHVLIGGLGLGIMASRMVEWGVESVTVVERNPDIVKLCAQPGYTVVVADIYDYLRTCPRFDCYYLDTWQGTSESTWWSEVMPLRRIINNRFGLSNVHCWAEDIMRGQVFRSALGQAGLCWKYKALPKGITEDEARDFLNLVGCPEWERRYGKRIDALDKPKRQRNQWRKPTPERKAKGLARRGIEDPAKRRVRVSPEK